MPVLLIQYPSGHRANIEVQPNTTLHKVLEMACEKRALDCTQYSLSHNRRPVDLSATFRLSGLVNRATLDLVALKAEETRRVNDSTSQVRVCFRLENGERAIWQGDPNSSLWTILKETGSQNTEFENFLHLDDGFVPAVAYFGEQIIGETRLRSMCLRDLGVSSGSVLLQLHRRTSSEEVQQQHKMDRQSQSVPSETATIPERAPVTSPTATDHEFKRPRTTGSMLPESIAEPQLDQSTTYDRPVPGASQPDPNFVLPWSVFGTPPQVSMFGQQPSESQKRAAEEPQTLGALLGIDLTPGRGPLPGPMESPYAFANFSFPSADEPMDTQNARNEDDTNDTPQQAAIDREMVVFRRAANTAVPEDFLKDLPDEFFEHTEADVRSLIQACRNIWNADEPLQTTAMRNAARLKLYQKYKRAVIQFHWSDAVVVQACFAPNEKLSALYRFVKELLRQPALKFTLYTTPPKTTLKESPTSLVEANLVPLAKVYFSAECSRAEEVLSASVLTSLATDQKSKANEIVQMWMNPNVASRSDRA